MILYLEDSTLVPEQTFRVTAHIHGHGQRIQAFEVESIEWILPNGAADVTKLLGDNEYAKIVAQAWELAKEEAQ